MVSYFFSGSFRVLFGNILFIIHKVKVNLIIGIIDALANIVLDIVLIRKWGSVGAAYATLIITILSSLLSGIYLFSYFAKAKKQSRSYFLKSKEMHE